MKKILITLLSVVMLSAAAEAQSAGTSTIDKETKAKAKEKQLQDIKDAMKSLGVTTEQAKLFNETSDAYGKKSSEIRKNASLSEEEKEKQLKANQEAKNNKLKEIIGEDKYKEFNKIRKAQKEKEAANQ